MSADQYSQERRAMAYNQVLKDRVKTALTHVPHVKEEQIFGGRAFMVNRKMCISVGKDTEALSMLTKMDEG